MKKFAALFLALAMVLGMMTFAAADEPAAPTIKITAPESTVEHTYEIFQIFTGDLSTKEGQSILSNLKWGKNAKNHTAGDTVDAAVITDLTAVNSAETDADKLAVILDDVDLTSSPEYIVTSGSSVSVAAGYYLIRDKAETLDGEDDAATLYIVQIVGDVTIAPKNAKPTVDKQVWDETTDAETGAVNGWGESADHAINESFQFKLIAQLPNDADITGYSEYQLVFTDTMSAGVTFEKVDSVKVYVGENDYTVSSYVIDGVSEGDAGKTWTLTIADIVPVIGSSANLKGAKVEVIYSAHLNEAAKVNDPGEGNTTNENTVDLQYSNNPYVEGEMGQTPEDHVWVFTYTMPNKKVKETADGAAMGGAGFKLYDSNGNEVKLIKDGSAYRPIKGEEAAEEMFSSASDGTFNIIGLDVGTYVLKETTVPAGYNKAPDLTVTITATHSEANDGASATTNMKMTNSDNGDTSLTQNTIVNKSGSTLPTTGGIGTTIFYVLGGLLAVSAIVLLVTKRRMSAN